MSSEPKVIPIKSGSSILSNAKITLLAECESSFAHEAGVWLPDSREVLFTSSPFYPHGPQKPKHVSIGLVNVDDGSVMTIIPKRRIEMANGATNYKGKVLVCQQGQGDITSALVVLNPYPPYDTEVLLDSFYGIPFNSPNDVVVNGKDGSIWFTDPDYAYLQGLRDVKLLPNMVYCFDPATKTIRVVADDVKQPNGIAFSQDYFFCYITDTSALGVDSIYKKGPETLRSAIYKYKVLPLEKGGYTLGERTVFAFATTPAPDGIKLDCDGNVYAGCGDGIHVWDSAGNFIAKIAFEGGISNFVFTDPGVVIALNETRIYKISNIRAKGALDYTL